MLAYAPMATVCAFGSFDLVGARSWVIRTGLQEAGYDLTFCNTSVRGFFAKMRDLTRRWRTMQNDVDALYVVFPSHYYMPLAWRLARRRRIPVILDAIISLYDTDVSDRRRVSRFHPKAWLLFAVDWLACHLADIILVDTEEHRQYFMRTFSVPACKIAITPVGCRTDLFHPQPERAHSGPRIIGFYGTFIPLQGIDTILQAAKELANEDVRFVILGKGQTYPAIQQLAQQLRLSNVEFRESVPLEKLPDFIAECDVCLGIFGTSPKALRVIPHKAYEVLQCGKPLITARTPASERGLRDLEHALLCNPGDSHDLAEKIRKLLRDPGLAKRIADGGRSLALKHFQPSTIIAPLVAGLKDRGIAPTPKDYAPISVHILTWNSGRTLERTLKSVSGCKEIIVIDGGSTDSTVAIAKRFSATVIPQGTPSPTIDFSRARSAGLSASTQPRILVLDSDETASPRLLAEGKTIAHHHSDPAAYLVPRRYQMPDGSIIAHASTYPNERIYFFHRDAVEGWIKPVHERVKLKPGVPLLHLNGASLAPLPTVAEYKEKNLRYLAIEAMGSAKRGWGHWFRHRLLHTLRSRLIGTIRLLGIWLLPHDGKRLPLRFELLRFWYGWRLIVDTCPLRRLPHDRDRS